jgi:hypothetical protein
VDLEAVIRRQQRDGIVDFLVMEYGIRQRIQRASSTARLGDCSNKISVMYSPRVVLGASHLVSRSNPQCSHWDPLAARPPFLQPSCPRIFSLVVFELLRALPIFPRPPPGRDLLLHGRLPFCLRCVERVAGTSAQVLVGHKKFEVSPKINSAHCTAFISSNFETFSSVTCCTSE